MCCKGWTIFQAIHPHSGTEGCGKKHSYPALQKWLAFRPCVQTLEGKKANSASCFSPRLEHREQAEKQITSGLNKQGAGPAHASQRYRRFLVYRLLAQGLWPSQAAASKFDVGSLVWYLQRETWGTKRIVRLYQMMGIRVSTMWPQFIQLLCCPERAVYKLSSLWCPWELVVCSHFICREESGLQSAPGPIFCVVLKLDFSCSVSFTAWIKGIYSCTSPLLQSLCSCLLRAVGRGGGRAAKPQQR